MTVPNVKVNWDAYERDLEEGNRNIKFGVGIGVFGAGSLAVLGATCPLCFFVAPALVGVGAWKRRCAKKQMAQAAVSRADDGTDGTIS
jgi:hypothetical protein